MENSPEYLFTYGTLMSGFDNPFSSRLTQHASYVGTGYFPGKLYGISWYPAAIYDDYAPGNVFGEIYQLQEPAILWPELDEYEDFFEDPAASLYLRRQVEINVSAGAMLFCWVYLYNQPVIDLKLIESGNFRDYFNHLAKNIKR